MPAVKNKKVRMRGARLPAGEALLRNVIENAVVPTFLVDASRITYANKAFADLLGYEPAEVIGLGINDLIHPDDRSVTRTQADEAIAGKRGGYLVERRYLHKNGDPV